MHQGVDIVDGNERGPQHLAGADEVAQVGARIEAAGIAGAGFINRARIAGILSVHQVHAPAEGLGGAVARQAGGQHAIEHIHSTADALDEIVGGADPHQVAGFVFRKRGSHHFNRSEHFIFRLADRKPTNGVPRKTECTDISSGLLAQVFEDTTLDDAKERLIRAGFGCQAALRPVMGAQHGLLVVCIIGGVGTFIESHDDIGIQIFLDGNGLLRGEPVQGAIDMAFKCDTILINAAQPTQRKDLKAARIGENGAIPMHELMQATQFVDEVITGAQIQMIGVGKDDGGIDLQQLLGSDSFNCCLSADRHEDRGGNFPMRSLEYAGAGVSITRCYAILKIFHLDPVFTCADYSRNAKRAGGILLLDFRGAFILRRMNNDNYATWLEIDLNTITANYEQLKKISKVPVMGVVKANAYGHGLEEIALHLQAIGAAWLGVARIEEALQLRESGVKLAIMVLGYTSPKRVKDAQKANIHLTVYDPLVAALYEKEADPDLGKLHLHAKIDTGMGRLGVPAGQALPFIENLTRVPAFDLEGVFTHFACADEPERPVTQQQLAQFEAILKRLKEKGIKAGIVHAANSAGTLNYPQAHYSMVRCGIAMYGLPPAAGMSLPEGFLPALAWKTRLISIKSMPEGHGISYGHRYHTREGERIGAIAVGYGDGMRRVMGNHVLLRGKKVPMVGSVCMDQCMINLDEVPDAQVGDEVVLIGSQNGTSLSATEVAEDWKTINYEVICGMAARMPRRYIR